MTKKDYQYTLADLLIFSATVLVIIAACITVFYNISFLTQNEVSKGINGTVETRCIGGYKFIIDSNGNGRQIIDEFSRGVKCK